MSMAGLWPRVERRRNNLITFWIVLGLFLACRTSLRGVETNFSSQIQRLLRENAEMRAQMQKQQGVIEMLSRTVEQIHKVEAERAVEPGQIQNELKEAGAESGASSGFSLGKVRISGEGGAGFFESGSDGSFPNSEFRVDEAKLFVDAPVWGEVYAFAELKLASHEASDLYVNMGELYLDFENVSQLWNREGQLNIRVGRLNIPFGEEYLARDANLNPLISHSLSDFWDVDEGVEIYGSVGKASYVVAVQNGGSSTTHDFTGDKAVVGRLSYDPKPWLHLSVSGMRTGDLDPNNDVLSAVWFGGGWFRSLGSTNTTKFHVNAVEGDLEFRLPFDRLKAFGGYVNYGDNDPAANNHRDVYYYAVEGAHDFTRHFYGAARFSQIFAARGFPIVGSSPVGEYLFGPLTEEIWRLSLGLGYRWNSQLALKTEYSLEQGRLVGGLKRNHEDLFAAEAVFGF